MEKKLESVIMTPAMIAVVLLGSILIYFDGVPTLEKRWMILKLVGVVTLLGWHVLLGLTRRQLAAGERRHSEKFWRMTNELPILVAIVIVLSVTTKFGA